MPCCLSSVWSAWSWLESKHSGACFVGARRKLNYTPISRPSECVPKRVKSGGWKFICGLVRQQSVPLARRSCRGSQRSIKGWADKQSMTSPIEKSLNLRKREDRHILSNLLIPYPASYTVERRNGLQHGFRDKYPPFPHPSSNSQYLPHMGLDRISTPEVPHYWWPSQSKQGQEIESGLWIQRL